MKNLRFSIFTWIFILLSALMTTTQARANGIVLKVGNRIYTHNDINQYVETTRLDNQTKRRLFSKANKNYKSYLKLKDEWRRPHFKSALKQLAYFLLLEKHALSEYRHKKRLAFNSTKRELNQQLQKIEDRAIAMFLKTGKGIQYAAKAFGEELIANGLPYSPQDKINPSNLYYQWKKDQRLRITETLRVKEVQKYEGQMAKKSNSRLGANSSFALHHFQSSLKELIANQLHEKQIDSNEVSKIIKRNPEVMALIKRIEYIGPQHQSLEKINHLHPGYATNLRNHLLSNLEEILSDKRLERLTYYESLIPSFAQKYDLEKLRNLKKEKRELYIQSNGSGTNLVLSRLYEMAILLKNSKANTTQFIRKNIIKDIRLEMKGLLEKLRSEFKEKGSEFLISNSRSKKLRLADQVYSWLNAHKNPLRYENKDALQYARKLRSLAFWGLKFQFIKFSQSYTPLIIVHQRKLDNLDNYKIIEKAYKKHEHLKGLKSFRKEELQQAWILIEINLDGQGQFLDQQAIDFILK
jgi:hypothetical protein